MRIKNNTNKKSIVELVARLRAARASAGGSPVQWHSFEPEVLIPALESFVELPETIPESDRQMVIRNAVYKAAAEATFDEMALRKHLTVAQRNYLRQPQQKFILATSWTVSPGCQLASIRLPNSTIIFGPPARMILDKEPIRHLIDEVAPLPHLKLLQVRVNVRARTPTGAFELGQYSLDYIRGILNFLLNRKTAFSLFSRRPEPVNQIAPGPIHTIHSSSGKLAVEKVWFELYRGTGVRVLGSEPLAKMEAASKRVRMLVRKCAYAREVQHGFVRYNRALDSPDHAVAFARLWTTIEYLADTSDHDQLIRRIAFLTKREEGGLVEALLKHVRDVRNGIVHVDASRERAEVRGGMEAYLYHLKMFAEWLLRFHVRNGRRFKTRESAAKFLDTPRNPEELRHLITLYQRALKYSS